MHTHSPYNSPTLVNYIYNLVYFYNLPISPNNLPSSRRSRRFVALIAITTLFLPQLFLSPASTSSSIDPACHPTLFFSFLSLSLQFCFNYTVIKRRFEKMYRRFVYKGKERKCCGNTRAQRYEITFGRYVSSQ